jgi:DinB superfamily
MNQSPNDQSLREQLISLLNGGNAHVSFDDFIKRFPVNKCGQPVGGLPYTAWQVLEHMRIAQWDILEFSRNADHVSPKWPKGYWPKEGQTGSNELWDETVARFRGDLKAFQDLLSDPANDLFAPIPHGTGQTILREALVLADHNSNHLGTLITIARILQQ